MALTDSVITALGFGKTANRAYHQVVSQNGRELVSVASSVLRTPEELLRDLARSGRLARLQIVLQDRPGALFRVMSEFHAHNVNIIEIYHQRIFTTLPAKGLTAEIECEARDGEQIDRLVDNLRAKGYSVELAELA